MYSGNQRQPEESVIRFCVLSSGSKGNAIWVESGGRALLVDAGLSGKELVRRMNLAGLDPARLEGILVTHEHRDHVHGVGVMARRFKIPVYINEATMIAADYLLGPVRPVLFRTGADTEIAGLNVHPFSISHDSADPVGFTFENSGSRLGLATDLGVATNLVRERLAGCHGLILESNHDLKMLMEGPYPWETKRRVKSRHGHLSNEDAAELLASLAHSGLSQVVLAHLSQTNNLPELALECVGSAVSGLPLTAARQDEPGPVVELLP